MSMPARARDKHEERSLWTGPLLPSWSRGTHLLEVFHGELPIDESNCLLSLEAMPEIEL